MTEINIHFSSRITFQKNWFVDPLQMKVAYPKLSKTEDLKITHKIVKKIRTTMCAGSPGLTCS